jgi:hypothetical protein
MLKPRDEREAQLVVDHRPAAAQLAKVRSATYRDQASHFGVSPQMIDDTLNDASAGARSRNIARSSRPIGSSSRGSCHSSSATWPRSDRST